MKAIEMTLPAVLSMAVSELNHMIDHWLASGLEDGAIAALNYGYKLITVFLCAVYYLFKIGFSVGIV